MNPTRSYRKLALANLLSLAGMKLFRMGRAFCARLIYLAIRLDPHRDRFKQNLTLMGINPDEKTQDIQTLTLPFYSIPEGCKLLSQNIQFFDTHQTVSFSLPKVISSDYVVSPEYQCEAKLPDSYLAEFKNATVFSHTELIIVNETALYDEVERDTKYIYAIKSPILSKVDNHTLTLRIPSHAPKTIETGIHLSKDHTVNYFHWIIECLPRLSLISQLDKTIPLLVDDEIPPQFFEALAVLNSDQRPVIRLKSAQSYLVKKLYYPSPLSTVHDNRDVPLYYKDAIYSPKAIRFVRDTVLQQLNIQNPRPWRKIFLSRKNARYRQLLNSMEIENFLVTQGFEIVFAEHLSFYAQVHLFSDAKIIIGQSGAGMTNFIFSPKECKILMLYNRVPQVNLHLFGALAAITGNDLEFAIGKVPFVLSKTYQYHADFEVDITLIKDFLEKHPT